MDKLVHSACFAPASSLYLSIALQPYFGYGGVPAYNIVNEFREAKDDLDRNIDAKTYWELQLKKYPAAFFYTVMDAINLSSQLASDWLIQYMFSGEEPVAAKKKATKIVKKLNANNKSHSRHFTVDFCKELGLNITELESDQTLQELVLSVHHAFIITIDATAAIVVRGCRR